MNETTFRQGGALADMATRDEAGEFQPASLGLFRQPGHRCGEADALDSLGCVYHWVGGHQQDTDCHRRAQATFAELGYRLGEICALNNLGHARGLRHRASPRELDRARRHRRHARNIHADVDQVAPASPDHRSQADST